MGTYTTPEVYTFNDSANSNLLPLMACMNGGGFGGGYNSPLWAIILLAFLRNGGIFGNGNNSQLSQIQDTLNTNQGNQLIMSAIQGNATNIKELASLIGCNHNAVTSAINGIQTAICNVGNQLGMSTASIVNAINAGDTSIITAVKDCCCQTQQNIIKMGYEAQINNQQQSQMIQNGFCQVGYEASQNANGIRQAISDQTIAINSKLDAMESSRKDREIASLTAQLATVNARAERASELAPIIKTLEEIKGKQPSTATIQYPNIVGIPAWQLYGYGYGAGQFGVNGGIFG